MSNSSNYNEDSNLEYDASISSFSNFIEESDDLDEDFSIESLSESENVYSDDQMEVDGSDEEGDVLQHYFRNMTRGVRENNADFLDSVDSTLPNEEVVFEDPSVSPGAVVSEPIPATLSVVSEPASSNADAPEEKCTSFKQNDTQNSEEDPFSCPICLEGLTNSGTHRPACLKCGHIFGDNCLQRWIKTGCNADARRCPTCNAKASLKDIRLLFAKKLVAIDTTELTALEVRLEKENREKNLMKAEVEKWKVKNNLLNNEVEKLKKIIEDSKNVQSCSSSSSSGPTSVRQCIKKVPLCKDAGCRVMAYNKNNLLLVVSQQSATIFNGHGIRKINASLLNPTRNFIHVHSKPIRDMTFHPVDHNLLATASLDKFVKLVDLLSETVISSIEVQEPLWSCCWAGDNTNMLIAGSQCGSLYYIDRRFMKLVDSNPLKKPGCVSLVPLPPSSSRSFMNGGFLKTRMDLLSVFEQDSNSSVYKETELPLTGLWSSTSYDAQSNLILSTAKPCGANRSIRHIVSKISDFNEGPVLHPVATFYGGNKATQLSRSCLVPSNGSNEDTLMCSYDEKSNAVQLFSVNSNSNIKNFPVQEKFLDFCPLDGVNVHGRRTVAGLSENAFSVFTV